MPARPAIVVVAAFTVLVVACGGGSSGGKTPAAPTAAATRASVTPALATLGATSPPGTPVPGTTATGIDALAQTPCVLLTDADITAFEQATGPGVVVGKPGENKAVTPVVVTREGIATSRCRWDMPGAAYLEVELYLLSGYASPQDYAKTSLAHWADLGKAASQPVAGIGDFAGLVIPSTHDTKTVAIFYAQKGTTAISVYFSGPPEAQWPTAAQLQALGTAAAARVF